MTYGEREEIRRIVADAEERILTATESAARATLAAVEDLRAKVAELTRRLDAYDAAREAARAITAVKPPNFKAAMKLIRDLRGKP